METEDLDAHFPEEACDAFINSIDFSFGEPD